MTKVYFNKVFCVKFKCLANKLFESAVRKVFSDYKERDFFANVKFVSKEEIKKLNSNFRNVDKVTDVLSFPAYNFPEEKIGEETEVFLGDIAICKPVAKLQAKEYGHSLKRELAFLALHGFLHIMGFDHIEKEDEEKMMKIAEEILTENGARR